MWSMLDDKMATRRTPSGQVARRRCEVCAAETTFIEREVTPAAEAHAPELADLAWRLMECDACGTQYATDEMGERAIEAEVEGGDEPDHALVPRRGEEIARPTGGVTSEAAGGGGRKQGILGRLGSLFRSNVSAAVERAVDPAKEIEQLILDMEEETKRARQETVRILGARKRAQARIVELEREAATWNERAEKAARAGDDELAKLALGRRAETETRLSEAQREEREAADVAAELHESLKKNEARLKHIKLRKGTIKAKLGAQRAGDLRAEAFEDFERMAGRVDDAETEVEALAELEREGRTEARDTAVAEKFAALERKGGARSEIDERLAALKKKMEK